MNRNQNIVFLLLLTINSLFSAQPSAKKPYLEPIKPYYGAPIFADAGKGKHHAPMLIIFDPVESEEATGDNIALTSMLALSIAAPFYPILVSGYLLKNLLIRTKEYEPTHFHSKNGYSILLKQYMDHTPFIGSKWDLYNVPQSPLVLLIPKMFSGLFTQSGKNLGIKALSSLNNLLPSLPLDASTKNAAYDEIIAWLEKNKPVKSLADIISTEGPTSTQNITSIEKITSIEGILSMGKNNNKALEEIMKIHSYDLAADLNKIFIDKSDETTPIWDIYIDGHGTFSPPIIAGLTPAAFNKVLSFFDRTIKAGTVFVLSCSAGGQNRTLLETTQDGVQINHNFILILGSISNSIVVSDVENRFMSIRNFFNISAAIEDKGTSINNLLRHIVQFAGTSKSYHGATGFPQIWFPGGYGFQTPQIVNGTLTLGNVFLKTHKENRQSITIENVLIVLLYPRLIDVPLLVKPFNVGSPITKEWKNLAFLFEHSFFKDIPESAQQSVIDKLKAEKILPDFLSQLPSLANENNPENPNYYLYPQFISMEPGRADYYFSKINVSSELHGKRIAQGLLQFIRDSFFDPSKESDHEYLIDSLTGLNDISLTLAASRMLANKEKHPLEEIMKDHIDKEITLKNIIISSLSNYIGFEFDNTVWIFRSEYFTQDPTKEMRWNFQTWDVKEYENWYKIAKEALLSGKPVPQKSISEILKEKQRQTILKKAIASERKEAAESAIKKYQEKLLKK